MNWKRGLFRLWLIGAVLWVGAWAVFARPDAAVVRYLSVDVASVRTANPFDQFDMPKSGTAGAVAVESLPRSRILLDRDDPEYIRREARERLYLFGAIGLAPPAVVFLFGLGLLWAFAGFGRAQ